ncbi:gliding motility protein GldF [Lentimonas sp. CC4]|uniref:ABC transporter permease n=2 Tax=Lentimonas TaxID=417293 RepID=UPI0013225561|nr:ABC transporter permease [Lentimonas sp. CC4]CAA6686939.1 gliding motility protein GldF [Lentimonas sp. CC6]CAA7169261.1 gliding motility protein GldF [Lentimonas sp. CC21]CAA7180343.1 gliding motility protein GldF [Lentimonas sp. CC8]CAA6677394.1 gliding motility protein GldF [Lentimonas sp. CC4]CAA7074640.1 gliding motility protein GldF [Lentimonas sp. CC4]
MRNFFILLKHELRMLLISPPTYIAAVLFLTLMGFLYWAILRGMVNTPEESLPIVQFLGIFWIPVFFVVPLLTMRSIAGERSTGTLDTLMTTPTSRVAVILSKFAGAYIFYMLLWLSTLGFPLIAAKFFPAAALSGSLLEPAPIVGGFTFLALSGILFVSIGIFASSITRSQLVAGMLSFTTLFVAIIGGQQLGNIAQNGAELSFWASELVNYLQIFQHLDDFSRGVIDTRPFFYYTSTGVLLLGLSTLVIEAKA